jgi:alpha-amylase/alpha-mannosidase (GH57 family)
MVADAFPPIMTLPSFCIHAHFYQPPREDPLTGAIPPERGADPYPNWNERIHAECYRPNADLGNFGRISFNIGPTLFTWLDQCHPDTTRRIVAQDRENVRRFGVGNAMAQAYNHTILPLSPRRDQVTQVVWGIADFEERFGRKPQGMWLPETAMDLTTLSVLAEAGIEYTILAPWQASQEHLDPTRPYLVSLPEGRTITVFFYHGGLSGELSFNPLLSANADVFARQSLAPLFRRSEPQIILLASDGELYGHHQPWRDYFLARLVDGAGTQAGIQATYPGRWLKEHPAEQNIILREETAWSCHHGLGRWLGMCNCTPNSDWKRSLRAALDHLGAALDDLYRTAALPHIADPWKLRDDYIHVILGQRPLSDLLAHAAGKRLPDEVSSTLSLLLEAQRERQRMFTSCGFFFEDFDRIEPQNNLAYAAQAVALARRATGVDLSSLLTADLQRVRSVHSGLRGDWVFNRRLQLSTQN